MQKYLFQQFFAKINSVPFHVHFWDGSIEQYGEGAPRFTITFQKEPPFTSFIKQPSLAFGEAYMNSEIDIEGNLEEVIRAATSNHSMIWSDVLSLLPRISLRKQQENVQHHYDVGNDFYSLWLDQTISYSCAYFHTPEDTLEQAQLQKIDHILRKLQLKEGETLLDIGSGWGWLIIRAAQQYEVKALGITLSEEQFKKTKERIAELGLTGQVDVELMSYQELAQTKRTFDKIASVGMFEHVGQSQYPTFMKTVQNVLKNGGLMLLHTITHQKEDPTDPWIAKHIFPGGYIPSFREIIQLLPEYDFHALDIENLRIHYAMTLDEWAKRFDAHEDKIRTMYDERFIRMWRLYLRSSAAFFRLGDLGLHQVLFSKGANNNLPLTRSHLYTTNS
ncbi:cyclopropane-fatty-acyl-phospholipid synthase [Aneurinibacillus soli]|uniref:Cyclopropane-fatty-acyl-phospholipid synthase n=2 Tax=Aneurinibacillus soli TaxID=1500254 RepID=A0A0U5AVK6_9BACL|nr:cyclopropane-fatty-acyl-phospholipid synthase [Aneurinibacillus soli]BAU27781.1 Cyclopropane-fatty-acyl-phospholipid synthase [Aneurinibacillus soli]